MCAPSELQFGTLREGGGTQEAGSTVAESLVVLFRVGTHQIQRRRRVARSSTSQGRAETLCEIIKVTNREVSKKNANGQGMWGFFKDAQGFEQLDAGSRADFISSRPPPSWTSVFQYSSFLYDVRP